MRRSPHSRQSLGSERPAVVCCPNRGAKKSIMGCPAQVSLPASKAGKPTEGNTTFRYDLDAPRSLQTEGHTLGKGIFFLFPTHISSKQVCWAPRTPPSSYPHSNLATSLQHLPVLGTMIKKLPVSPSRLPHTSHSKRRMSKEL